MSVYPTLLGTLLIVCQDRKLCIPDHQHQQAVRLFESRRDILERCGPLPLSTPNSLNHKYPRFKAIGRTDFWLLLPASNCHLDCRPDTIEWSKGGLPYPKLAVYMQSLLNTLRLAELETLIDGMDPSEEWGENLMLDGCTDSEWADRYIETLREDGVEDMFIFIDNRPTPRRTVWQKAVRNKQRRLGFKYPPERYATRYRRHGSKDPRTNYRRGL